MYSFLQNEVGPLHFPTKSAFKLTPQQQGLLSGGRAVPPEAHEAFFEGQILRQIA